ncbi:hypothetical protein BDB01DRAFT_781482 [Pilobolus umbonatus]|nr:hypothetical protein BDB01DRAFT_781482 [Pilobolus umbonatus]
MSLPSLQYQTRRLFHSSLLSLNHGWSKAALRKMKKVELVELAKKNNITLGGTKNDHINQLIAYQDSLRHKKQPVSSKEKTDKVINAPEETAVSDIPDALTVDGSWVEAFEAKVGLRGTRKPQSENKEHFTSFSAKKNLNGNMKMKTFIEATVNPSKFVTNTTKDVEALEGMNAQWVEALDMKIGSRQAERHLIDTLSTTPVIPTTEQLSIVTISKEESDVDRDTQGISQKKESVVDKAEKDTVMNTQSISEKEESVMDKSEKDTVNKEDGLDRTRREDSLSKKEKEASHQQETENKHEGNTFISTVIGSGLLIWYLGGGEGFSKIGHFLDNL